MAMPRAAMASLHRNSLMLERSTFLPSPSLGEGQKSLINQVHLERSIYNILLMLSLNREMRKDHSTMHLLTRTTVH